MSNMSNNNQSQIHQTQRQYINKFLIYSLKINHFNKFSSDPFKNTNYLKQENQYMPRINKFHDNEYQNLSYKQPYEPINSMKMANDTRANAKIYGERNVTFNNEPMIQPLFPKQFLENNLILSKQLIQKAPQDYRYILSRNIQNLGGIEDTISSKYVNLILIVY